MTRPVSGSQSAGRPIGRRDRRWWWAGGSGSPGRPSRRRRLRDRLRLRPELLIVEDRVLLSTVTNDSASGSGAALTVSVQSHAADPVAGAATPRVSFAV
jgi:hypothetical protein